MPHFIVGAPESVADGFPPKATILVELPKASTARLSLADGGVKGAVLQVRVDGAIVGEQVWSALALAPGEKAAQRPREITFSLAAGRQEIVIENTGGADWVEFGSLEFGVEIPVVARGHQFGRLVMYPHARSSAPIEKSQGFAALPLRYAS